MTYDCIIIGAGSSGLFTGAVYNRKTKGLILEKTNRPGTKLLVSGGGHCNITHAGTIKDFITKYGPSGRKIRSCLYHHNNDELTAFFEKNKVPLSVREDGKVFPVSMKASDILELLLSKCRENGFELKTGSEVTGISRNQDGTWRITASGTDYNGRKIVLASGGCSYPKTGSDGSFFRVLSKDLGLDITELRPCLTPVYVAEYPYACESGISFENAGMSVMHSGKQSIKASGSLLFTHENFSGPLVLDNSRYIYEGDEIIFSYLYPLTRKEVQDTLTKALNGSRSSFVNTVSKATGLPKSFIQLLADEEGEKAKAVAARIAEDRFTVKNLSGFSKAIATSGGISLSEVNLKTMELKNHPGIFACGEILDIDGDTGGYNLQFAYSSACTIADNI